ncbi:lipocalin-like domain-containing protein [Shewanella sp. A32]|uniref:lipocalin-like domain-containing protein n=1 Tax=Shewanella sp. A32 TaxID=3031327 RepID=UPI0023B9A318|nr:lipocalin-like domain-containing protein [Shewanella sp. A32]MDF0533984.1 lipocalin-like domain-containing protein [Shewanella sp. A32]
MKRHHLFGLLPLLLLTACTPAEKSASMGQILGRADTGFAQVLPGKNFAFPEDHLAHPKFRQEWWYLTANLHTADGTPLGLQWTQFRIALSAAAPASSSPWASNQLYMAHAALTFKQQHLTAERWGRGTHGEQAPAQVSGPPLSVRLDDWQWQAQAGSDNPNHGLLPATLSVADAQFAYNLQLSANAPLVLQGDHGYSRKSADGKVASYYYSQPFINVDGTVLHQGRWQHVSGIAWLDREWSSEFLSRQQQGWDWFALHLNDGSALMLFQLRGTDKSDKAFYSGKRMFPDGRSHSLSAKDIRMQATAWQQTTSGRYPVSWHLSLPTEQLELDITPLNRNAVMPLSVSYWEGPISISGSQQGAGYLELTGY